MVSASKLLASACLVASSFAYDCPATCLPPACVCASKSIPGGLPVAQTPQFVTITWDDSVQDRLVSAISPILKSSVNPNGCFIPSTYFSQTLYTEFNIVQNRFWSGDEIAVHTMSHPDLVKTFNPAEISGCKQVLSTQGGVPKSKITGFRHPLLSFNKPSFDAVFQNVNYDSSLTVNPITQGFWPFTLDYGLPFEPQPCVGCPPGIEFKYPGKWEVPMYNILDSKTNLLFSSMDPVIAATDGQAGYDVALENLKATFRIHYANKLPFGLYQHAAQYITGTPEQNAQRAKYMSDFIKFTMSSEFADVWYVTNQQLINWVQKPVTADKMKAFIPCVPPPVDPSNIEICDGIDNDGDGIIDNGLTTTCTFNENGNWNSCFGCPSSIPIASNPSPALSPARSAIPDIGCDGLGVWDPVGNKCVQMKRPAPVEVVRIDTPSGGKVGPPFTNGTSVGAGNGAGRGVVSSLVLVAVGVLIFFY